ncbi:Uncharacterised protein [Mycobacteroides abscessus subsp. massiliense]|uniref:hypothetical protein n=1 Tax=Mycobacteroides abscessus TaxID=36809 RepID=UPI0009A6DDCB|nr:hypothetical protein [Mycobacteroides abscessus]SKM81938.1 Uncharacterised protein [Mycobacteroides abscessus subsp. massiliense]SKM98645.1 Uncharacterised protein [Mycobacteroides abscessus subsp. massiliense]SKN77292.1 Uncharacterised protein [Mycobacteroides abscessus subsp. massiliense]SKN95856.1 Uncharacterised protein [Mycobacteroides abscessus subsp. massiliense]SKO22560.1 Uncharacterised protein [Mycobacteroides abscessus subsp. massiliense]
MDLSEMITAAEQQTDNTPGYLDGRVTINDRERLAATIALDKLLTGAWLKANCNQANGGLHYAGRAEVLRVILCAINTSRLGLPEGTVATHGDGRFARRYYSDAEQRLTWLVVQPPSDKQVEVESGPELPGLGWKVRDDKPWQVVR